VKRQSQQPLNRRSPEPDTGCEPRWPEAVPGGHERHHDKSSSRGSPLLAPLRWLGRKLSGLVRWAARRLRAPLRPIARLLTLRWVAELLPAPLRWLGRLIAGRERGFGFWWLVVTLGVAVALGLVVALLLTPVAGLIALLLVAIWALVRRRRHKRDDRDDHASRAPAHGAALRRAS
jgi:hypothetical protein